MHIHLDDDTDLMGLNGIPIAGPETQAASEVTTPARAEKKPRKKKPAKKAVAKGKTAPRGKAKKSASTKKSSAPRGVGKKPQKNGEKKRGPKGNPPDKVKRSGDATYGKRVAKARGEREWTQKDLAAKLNITQPAVCNIEKGTVCASPELQKVIAKVLGVSLAVSVVKALERGVNRVRSVSK